MTQYFQNKVVLHEFIGECLPFWTKLYFAKNSTVCYAICCIMDPNFQTGLWQRTHTTDCSYSNRHSAITLNFFFSSSESCLCVLKRNSHRSAGFENRIFQFSQTNIRSEQRFIQWSMWSNWPPQACEGASSMASAVHTQNLLCNQLH